MGQEKLFDTYEVRDTVRESCKWNKVEERDYGRRWDGLDRLRILRPYKVWISYYVKWWCTGGFMEHRRARIFFKRIILDLEWRLDCKCSRAELRETRKATTADTGKILVLYMGRHWLKTGRSHAGAGEDNWIWDILWRKRWQDELMDSMWNIRIVKDDYKILAWGIERIELPSTVME